MNEDLKEKLDEPGKLEQKGILLLKDGLKAEPTWGSLETYTDTERELDEQIIRKIIERDAEESGRKY